MTRTDSDPQATILLVDDSPQIIAGLHIVRMSDSTRLLTLAAGVPETQADLLHQAAPMPDIGKIGIPDRILLKRYRDTLRDAPQSDLETR